MYITKDPGELLLNYIICGKIKLRDIDRVDRIYIKSLYIAEHRRNRPLRTVVQICEYKELLDILLCDIANTDDKNTRSMLAELYQNYKQYLKENANMDKTSAYQDAT